MTAEQERAAVVAWLREQVNGTTLPFRFAKHSVAAAIERGEHKEPKQ